MKRATALALAPALVLAERNPAAERDALEQIATWALQFSPSGSLQAAEEKYKAGRGTVIDVTDAEQSLRQAEADEVKALYDYNTSLATLRAAVGQAVVPGTQ